MKKNSFLLRLLSLCLILQGCASSQKRTSDFVKFDLVNPGDTYQNLLDVYGSGEEEDEPFSEQRLKVVSYKNNKTNLREDFYIDPDKKKVVLKMKWLNSQLSESDVDTYIKKHLPNENFKIYYPCHSFGEQRIFIGTQTHLQLHTLKQNIHTISVGTAEYTKNLIDKLYKNCESIQPQR